MSEFHPNRQGPVKTKLGLTRRRILESWPLLIWVAVALAAVWGYNRGRVFSRMNGAVDVYQENISPIQDGRLLKILFNRGDEVAANTIVAQMDPSIYERELSAILRGVATNRLEEISRQERLQLDLESELRKLQIADAGDTARTTELISARDRLTKSKSSPSGGTGRSALFSPGALDILTREKFEDLNADIAELEGKQKTVAKSITKVEESLNKINAGIDRLRTSAETTANADPGKLTPEVLGSLSESEQKDVNELLIQIELTSLRTTRGGIIDRLEKEPGEYVAQGQAVLRVVADPDQIVAFLPQDQIGSLQIGDTVWITPAMDRALIFESKVLAISPRINNLADATSPLPNRRLYGRDVVCSFPPEALPKTPGQTGLLVPGQTVTVHTQRPGELPLMNRIFHNDDVN